MQSLLPNQHLNSPLGDGGIYIQLTDTGKRFNRDWIFRHMNCLFAQGKSYAITGPNGSGKSTLLQTIAGAIAPSEGTIEYRVRDRQSKPATANEQLQTANSRLTNSVGQGKLQTENLFNHIAIVAPYLEVIEEMTATEFLYFHASFKPLLSTITINEILEIVGLKTAARKQIRFYSSGMKQRIKLAQAIFSDVPILLLDEPCTNLDTSGYDLYHQLINDYCKKRLVIVSSNDVNEYSFCEEKVSILNYK
ncbi:MAG TPA: ATP-binding cassette domain-containing protein [Chitinophagaceae bacterium]|jgi:ABC-type multidrug transport system ATPase subunit